MWKDVRRVPSRGSHEPRLRLLRAEGKPAMVGAPIVRPEIDRLLAHVAQTPERSRDDATAGGMFTTWDRPPVTKVAEASVVTAFDGTADVTAVGAPGPGWRAAVRVIDSRRAWAFVAVATVTFAVVSVAIDRRARAPSLGGPEGQPKPRAPVSMVVSSIVAPLPPAPVPAAEAPPTEAPAPVAARSRVRTSKKLRAGRSIDDGGQEDVRGSQVPVESGSLFTIISLPSEEPDARFVVKVTPSWATPLAIVGKRTTGFTISFGTPAPDDAHLDWRLVR